MHSVLEFDRFNQLWRRGEADEDLASARIVHQQLLDAYSEPQRHYHTLDHIAHCLKEFDKIRDRLQNPRLCELAIWFHDFIYKTSAGDNELRSAQKFKAMTESIFDAATRDTGFEHIMATVHDGSPIANADTRYLVDIDLSSFGLPWPDFMRDNDNLRLEMSHLSDAEYERNHSAFQHRLLERPRIFFTDYFYQAYEQRARQNISDFLDLTARNAADDS